MSLVSTQTSGAAGERQRRAELWLDDLQWHRHMFKESRFRWTGEHVLSIVTRYTGGQLSFTTVRHLELLQQHQSELQAYSHQCRLAMAMPLREARNTLGSWEAVSEAVGLSVVDCRATVWLAVGEPPEARTNMNVEQVLRSLPFSNPMLQAWELKQLWQMYEAAVGVLEDATCDLVEELRSCRPAEVLVQATGALSWRELELRIQDARARRGPIGDPRRIPAQAFSTSDTDSFHEPGWD
jgi:hypothetical protein